MSLDESDVRVELDIEPGAEPGTFDEVMERRFGRRAGLQAAVVAAGGAVASMTFAKTAAAAGPYAAGELTYDAVPPNGNDAITLPAGFTHDIIISWGDPVVPGAPAFDIQNQTEAAQQAQCGFNHDYLA